MQSYLEIADFGIPILPRVALEIFTTTGLDFIYLLINLLYK